MFIALNCLKGRYRYFVNMMILRLCSTKTGFPYILKLHRCCVLYHFYYDLFAGAYWNQAHNLCTSKNPQKMTASYKYLKSRTQYFELLKILNYNRIIRHSTGVRSNHNSTKVCKLSVCCSLRLHLSPYRLWPWWGVPIGLFPQSPITPGRLGLLSLTLIPILSTALTFLQIPYVDCTKCKPLHVSLANPTSARPTASPMTTPNHTQCTQCYL